MEEHQIVIAQFAGMTELARQMESIPALVLDASYSYQSFGSWWFEFKKGGFRYRVAYDGRDSTVTLDSGGRVTGGELPHWRTLIWRSVDRDAALNEALSLVRAASQDPAV
jgi:hypothetical protein